MQYAGFQGEFYRFPRHYLCNIGMCALQFLSEAMTGYFEIHEEHEGLAVRLRPTGELDLGSAPALRRRLAELCSDGRLVWLDLSGLEFMDSNGIHILLDAFEDAGAHGWHFALDAALSPPVARLFELTDLQPVFGTRAMSCN